MEDNQIKIDNETGVKLENLAGEISSLQQKISKIEGNKIWYKNYPFILSLITFVFTGSISLYTLYNSKREKIQTAYSSNISSIISSIDNLKNYDKEYYQELASANIDNNTKTALTGVYYSKITQTIDDITRKMNNSVYDDLEPSALNDYARYLQLLGQTNEAIKINIIALKKCKEKYTQITIMRTLGNLYSLPGISQSIDSSRYYRIGALNITKSYNGDYSTFNTMQSFIFWANDEYVNFNNKKFANALLDSARFYAGKLQEYNPQKYESIKQIRGMYNYFNDVLNISFGTGRWDVKKGNTKIGTAYISFVNNSYNMNIDLIENYGLKKEISGGGNFIGENKMKILGVTSYIEKINIVQYTKIGFNNQPQPEVVTQYMPQQRTMTMELEILKNKLIKTKYYEIGKSIETWNLEYISNF